MPASTLSGSKHETQKRLSGDSPVAKFTKRSPKNEAARMLLSGGT
jgi:hypothetical protein